MPCHLIVLLTTCLPSALTTSLIANLKILGNRTSECNTDIYANIPLSDNTTGVYNPGDA